MNQTDVLVIGAGVSGLSCALYTSKAGLNTVVLEHGESQLKSVKMVYNIPGIQEGISGAQWLESARTQVFNAGGSIHTGKVESLALTDQPYTVVTTDGRMWSAQYLVIAVNLGYPLLESLGFEVAINEHVPSKKIRKVLEVGYDGKSHQPGVFFAGLLTDVPSQTIIAAGQGAFVGVQIASDFLKRPFMWHD
ncbi:NAD(P)/FAD-dependent oxidoreductase [Alicyclobacillus mengziensis]|uniref:FAD-binding protein n=1 Tax=Alicyclobacillus mengziensis TaxID=2931921 RepID=A0A9X7Z837_9BACL|nr:FAD-dependent oxidoreductase [Alicyclobacillus mengziensis]QSO47806.1 FAD-binding protein [Alicyclobacillus mengziensis]